MLKKSNTIFPLLICLYFSQGLPSGLLAHALPAIMRENGVSLQWIGAMKILALPWFLKFLWAPYIDQRWQRKNWILLFQGCVIPLMLFLSFMQPEQLFSLYLVPFLLILLLLNTCSASQDIATDGLVVEQLKYHHLGYANAIQVAAYKVGLILGGTALLILLDTWGWFYSFQFFAGLLTLCLLPLLFYKNINPPFIKTTDNSAISAEFQPSNDNNNHHRLSIKAALMGYISDKNNWHWLLIVASYKFADGLGSSMLKPMLIDNGYRLADIGYLTTASSLCGIAGAGISGLFFARFSTRNALLGFGFLQACGIGLLSLIPSLIQHAHWVYAILMFEQMVDGISTVALFAAMMLHCRKGLEGTDYTIQNSIHVIGAGIGATASGFLANALGYEWHFMIAAFVGFVMLSLIFNYKKIIQPHHLQQQVSQKN